MDLTKKNGGPKKEDTKKTGPKFHEKTQCRQAKSSEKQSEIIETTKKRGRALRARPLGFVFCISDCFSDDVHWLTCYDPDDSVYFDMVPIGLDFSHRDPR